MRRVPKGKRETISRVSLQQRAMGEVGFHSTSSIHVGSQQVLVYTGLPFHTSRFSERRSLEQPAFPTRRSRLEGTRQEHRL